MENHVQPLHFEPSVLASTTICNAQRKRRLRGVLRNKTLMSRSRKSATVDNRNLVKDVKVTFSVLTT